MRLVRAAAGTTACTLATLLVAVAAAPGATAASSTELLYNSTTSTGVVSLTLRLPSTVPALPGVPNPISVTLLGTQAQGHHGAADADVANAQSFLAGGTLVSDSVLSGALSPLSRTLSASLSDSGAKSAGALSLPGNPLGLAVDVGSQKASVTPASRVATSSGTLADVSLGSLRSLGLGAVLDPALAQLNAALATVTSQATPLTDALAAVPALPSISVPNPLAGVVGGPATIATPPLSGATLSGTVNELPAQIQALTAKLLDGAAVTIKTVDTGQAITPAASSVTATGHSSLASVDLFGGLVSVKATQASATAKAGVTKSAATSDASATLLEVKVSTSFGDLLRLVASDKGITAGLLDGSLGQTLDTTVRPVVQAVDAALNTVLSELTALLSSLNSGASLIQQGTVSKKVSADGHAVEAHAVPAQVTIGLPIAPNLLTLAIGKADAVSALSVAQVTPVTPATPPTSLPRTGLGEQGGLLALGVLIVGAATVGLRRRATA
jgi:hypothetical protein